MDEGSQSAKSSACQLNDRIRRHGKLNEMSAEISLQWKGAETNGSTGWAECGFQTSKTLWEASKTSLTSSAPAALQCLMRRFPNRSCAHADSNDADATKNASRATERTTQELCRQRGIAWERESRFRHS
eukprot:6203325-Pleurochrysis_carterae.AAC.1